MRIRAPYDDGQNPPAPMLPVRLGQPAGEAVVALPALLDTGADMSVIPEGVAHALSLPVVGSVPVTGPGWSGRSRVLAVQVEAGGQSWVIEAVALGEEVLLGRDLLNRWHVVLDGPGRSLEIR